MAVASCSSIRSYRVDSGSSPRAWRWRRRCGPGWARSRADRRARTAAPSECCTRANMPSNNSVGSAGRSSSDRIAAFTAGSARRCASSSRLHSACSRRIGGPVAEAVVALESDHHAERPRRDLRVQAGCPPRARPRTGPASRATGSGRRRPGSERTTPAGRSRRSTAASTPVPSWGRRCPHPRRPAGPARTPPGRRRPWPGRDRTARPRRRTCRAPARRPSRGAPSCATSRSRARRPRSPR